MGSQLVRQVEALHLAGDDRIKGLSNPARLVLYGMALNALDRRNDNDDEPGCYFRGWEHLAVCWFGYPERSEPGKQAVKKAVRELTARKLIVNEGRRSSGSQSHTVYRLHLLRTSTK